MYRCSLRLILSLTTCFAAANHAYAAPNVAGSWSIDIYIGQSFNNTQTWNLTDSGTGSIGGTGGGGSYTWTIQNGTLSGNTIHLDTVYNQLSYTATFDGTVSEAGANCSMSGTWTDGGLSGSFNGTRSGSCANGDPGNDPNPDDNVDPNKRNTATKIFCNRSGDLSTVTCFASVADLGAPPRINPTGEVAFTATAGTLLAPSCSLQAVSFSPGVASCSMTYLPPAGFPIGAEFPVTATYQGDTNFNRSSASHELIYATCIGTPSRPCPNSVGLGFGQLPRVIDNLVSMLANCGGGQAPVTNPARDSRTPTLIPVPPGGTCNIAAQLGIDLEKLIEEMPQADLKALSDMFSQSPTSLRDAVIDYANAVGQYESSLYLLLQQNQPLVDEIVKILEKNVLNENWTELMRHHNPRFLPVRLPAAYSASRELTKRKKSTKKKGKKKKKSLLSFARITRKVKADETATLKFKLTPRLKSLVSLLRNAGVTTLPMTVTVTATQKNRSGKATVTREVDVTL